MSSSRRITRSLSPAFKWFNKDFDKVGGVSKFLSRYAPENYRKFLKNTNYTVNFKSYNWGLNDQGPHKPQLQHAAVPARQDFLRGARARFRVEIEKHEKSGKPSAQKCVRQRTGQSR